MNENLYNRVKRNCIKVLYINVATRYTFTCWLTFKILNEMHFGYPKHNAETLEFDQDSGSHSELTI